MDTAYLKQTVGTAVSEALTELILHGHSQIHPKLSINLETNPYSTTEDPVTFVARYLLNYSEKTEKCRKDDQERQKVTSVIDKIHRKKKEEEFAIQKAQEEKIVRKALEVQLEEEKLKSSIIKQEEVPVQEDQSQEQPSVPAQESQPEAEQPLQDQQQPPVVEPEGEQE